MNDYWMVTYCVCCCCWVANLCPTLCHSMNCNIPGFPVLHCLPEFPQTHVHWVSDAIQICNKSWLKTQYSKNEDHCIQSHCFMANRWGKSGNCQISFLGSKITANGDHKIKRCLLLGRIAVTNLDSVLKKERHHYRGLYTESYGFSWSHVWMWELDHKEGWVLKNW